MLNCRERSSLLKRFSDLCSAADHVEWVLVVYVLVRRHFPSEFAWIHVMGKLRHRDTREPWLKSITIQHVNLYSTTRDTSMLLKCRLKSAGPEEYAGQFEIIQRIGISIRVDVWCAN